MYCMHCGEEIPDSSRFCKYCGMRVEEVTAEAKPVINEPEFQAAAEEYEIVEGFFFRGLHPFKKCMLLILSALLTLLVAAAVFMGTYPSLVSEVWNIIK